MRLASDLEDYRPSVLLHCWLGHLTCKIVSKMTYNVSNGTLNPTIPTWESQNVSEIFTFTLTGSVTVVTRLTLVWVIPGSNPTVDPAVMLNVQVFDRNSDGYISKTELYQTMKELGVRLSMDDLNEMMSAADINRDGRIDYAGNNDRKCHRLLRHTFPSPLLYFLGSWATLCSFRILRLVGFDQQLQKLKGPKVPQICCNPWKRDCWLQYNTMVICIVS